jgi:hypothetical protein
MTQNDIIELVAEIAHEMGLPVEYALKKCAVESSFNPMAKNPSGAAGLFQIMPMHRVSNVYDPEINTRWAMNYALKNGAMLKERGFEVTPVILYLAHQQGPAGVRAILRGAANEKMLSELPREIQRNVAHNMPPGAKNVRTCQDFLDGWEARFEAIKLPQRAQELLDEYDDA